MKSQPLPKTKTNDIVMTPRELTKKLVEYFNPQGKVLEPCCGTGNFLEYLPKDSLWCEITKGRDFFQFNQKVDWIFTNPPYSIFRRFLQHSMKVSDNICVLITINHIWTKARIRDIKENGFGIKEILMIDTPKDFPQSGFQYGMVHLRRGYKGDVKLGTLYTQRIT